MKTIKKFTQKLRADEDLNAEYKKLSEAEDINAVESFMKKHGVSSEDLKALQNNEISDNELDGVAGGGESMLANNKAQCFA